MEKEKRDRRAKVASDLTLLEQFALDAFLINDNADMCYRIATERSEEQTKGVNYHKLAIRYVNKPHVKDYLGQRRAAVFSTRELKQEQPKFRDKDSVLAALEAEVPYLKGKDRADVLMKIADLQQMKKEETIAEDNTVHFYVPISCKQNCSLYANATPMQRKKADEERNRR